MKKIGGGESQLLKKATQTISGRGVMKEVFHGEENNKREGKKLDRNCRTKKRKRGRLIIGRLHKISDNV